MFDKFFETVARKQLTENAFDRWRGKRQYIKLKKRGFIVRYPNGMEGFDIVKCHASNLKHYTLFAVIAYPVAAIIGNVLGNIASNAKDI